MNGKFTKICAIAVVLAFACSAFAVVCSDNSDASDSEKTYRIHFEEVGSDYTVSKAVWITFQTSDSTFAKFQAAANNAFAIYGIDATFNASGWLTSTTYGSGFSTYYADNGSWKAVADPSVEYSAATEIAIEAGAGSYTYGSAPPAEVIDKYIKVSDTYYTRAPSATSADYKPFTHNLVYEEIGDDCKVSKTTKFAFDSDDTTLTAFVASANVAFLENGLDASFNAMGWISSKTYGSSNATWISDGSEWKAVETTGSDYNNAKGIAIEAGSKSYFYNAEPPADMKDKYSGPDKYNMYYRIPDTAADWFEEKNDDHSLRNGLIIGGVIAVVLVAAIAFFAIGSKKQ